MMSDRPNSEVLNKLVLPPNTIINEKDGTPLVLIPEGEFLTGPDYDWMKGGKLFLVRLPAFYLALHPITNNQYKMFVEETGYHSPDDIRKNKRVLISWVFPSKEDYHPARMVSWGDVKAYNDWAGLRLPTELEWEKGARGIDGREYPWGNEWKNGKYCRNYENKGNESTCGVWCYPGGVSPWGIYQMSGNVEEWCEDWFCDFAYRRYQKGNIDIPANGERRVVRGGNYILGMSDYFKCAARASGTPSHQQYDVGFRCAKDA